MEGGGGAPCATLEGFLERLKAARIGGTFNQYRETGGDDASAEAPLLRLGNLRRYLLARRDAPVLLVAEAAGWRGARYSGLCLCAERDLGGDGSAPAHFMRTSRNPRGWAEASATVVQTVLRDGGWGERVLLFNLVPTHPAGPTAHSNRPPTAAEVGAGGELLGLLIEMVRPRRVGAVGRVAGRALGDVPTVRHPSHGGAVRCRAELSRLLGDWL